MTGEDGHAAAGGPLSRARLVRWAHLVAERLERARAQLDALNVFPVADGDTGTNLALTVSRALGAADDADGVARALLVQARGSSGVIASQLVRGWTEVLLAADAAGRRPLDAPGGVPAGAVAEALARGDALAWQAVAEPVEGTVLSV
uniref:DAK2 domain-containing protein n=1 Tax=Aquipuribacter sp. SD81 TaxID=3127703 RepID=UPI003017419C